MSAQTVNLFTAPRIMMFVSTFIAVWLTKTNIPFESGNEWIMLGLVGGFLNMVFVFPYFIIDGVMIVASFDPTMDVGIPLDTLLFLFFLPVILISALFFIERYSDRITLDFRDREKVRRDWKRAYSKGYQDGFKGGDPRKRGKSYMNGYDSGKAHKEEREAKWKWEREQEQAEDDERQGNGKRIASWSDYEILGITEEASDEEVKKAWKAMLKKYHADATHFDSNDMAKAINGAYDRIMEERGKDE